MPISLRKVPRSLWLVSAASALLIAGAPTATATVSDETLQENCEVWQETIDGEEVARAICNEPGGDVPLVYRVYANCTDSPALLPQLFGADDRVYTKYGGYINAGEISSTRCTDGDTLTDYGVQAQ